MKYETFAGGYPTAQDHWLESAWVPGSLHRQTWLGDFSHALGSVDESQESVNDIETIWETAIFPHHFPQPSQIFHNFSQIFPMKLAQKSRVFTRFPGRDDACLARPARRRCRVFTSPRLPDVALQKPGDFWGILIKSMYNMLFLDMYRAQGPGIAIERRNRILSMCISIFVYAMLDLP